MSGPRGGFRRALRLAAVAALVSLSGADAFPETTTSTAGTAAITSRPIAVFHPSEPERTRFGELEFLGGLVLTSSDRDFRSLSGLHGRDFGREYLSVSDDGDWVWFRLKTDDAGRPLAVSEARIAPLRGADRAPLHGKWESDAESLTVRRLPDGRSEALVGFEGHHRVLSYDLGADWRDVLEAPGRPVPGLPRGLAELVTNTGLEGLAVAPAGSPLAGRLLLLAEQPRPGEADQPIWIVGGAGEPALLHLARRDHFAVTDAAFLPGGDLIVLQRRFGLRIGLGLRLLRIAAADLVAGRTVTGHELLSADWGWEIDNMEGLSVDVAPDGSTVLTLVSDDNGSWLQRTILLRFRLVGPAG